MDYDAIVTQALALLQREQRLAYRVLKLRLQLDDDLMEAWICSHDTGHMWEANSPHLP